MHITLTARVSRIPAFLHHRASQYSPPTLINNRCDRMVFAVNYIGDVPEAEKAGEEGCTRGKCVRHRALARRRDVAEVMRHC